MHCERDLVTREHLTAPHYLALSWMLHQFDELEAVLDVLDFGCKRSLLCAILAERGHHVTGLDRDPAVHSMQEAAAKTAGAEYDWQTICADNLSAFHTDECLDVVTAMWAVQHNFPVATQGGIVENLCRLLRPGGTLLVVSSYSPFGTVQDIAREDPQLRLDLKDVLQHLVSPVMVRWPRSAFTCEFFKYEHASVNGDWCPSDEANAVAWRLMKGA